MAHTRKTLTLDKDTWDIQLTASGRIDVSIGDYATAQDVSNECRLFTKDAYFDQERGIPYYELVLGPEVSASTLRAYLRDQAEYVGDVQEVQEIQLKTLDTETRVMTGDIRFTSKESGNELTADL